MNKITLFAFLFFTFLSFSQTGEQELYTNYKKAEKEVNEVYSKLMNKLDSVDQTTLEDAQKAWLNYRDLNCKFLSKEDSEGGVIANKIKIDCLSQTTLERIDELKKYLDEF